MMGDLFAMLNDKGLDISKSPYQQNILQNLFNLLNLEKFQEE